MIKSIISNKSIKGTKAQKHKGTKVETPHNKKGYSYRIKLLFGFIGLFCLLPFLINGAPVDTPPSVDTPLVNAKDSPQLDANRVDAHSQNLRLDVKDIPQQDANSEKPITPFSSSEKTPPPEKTSLTPSAEEPAIPYAEKTPSKKRLGYYHYSFASSFGGSGIGGGYFDRPVAIYVDSQDNIYVLDKGNNLIQKFDQHGEFIYEWGKSGSKPGEFDNPSSIVIDKDDNIYVADTNNNRIQKFDFGSREISYPSDLQVGSLEIDRKQIIKVVVIGSLGAGTGKFQKPVDIAAGDNDDIYVLDAGNNRIQKFNRKGEFLKELGGYGSCRECFFSPSKLAYDPTGFGYLYVLDQNQKGFLLHKIDTTGNFLKTLDVFRNDECPISQPTDIYVDMDGLLYIIDQATNSIVKFNTDGEFIQKIGEPSSSPGEAGFKSPQAIIQSSDKGLLILDSGDNKIKVFDQI